MLLLFLFFTYNFRNCSFTFCGFSLPQWIIYHLFFSSSVRAHLVNRIWVCMSVSVCVWYFKNVDLSMHLFINLLFQESGKKCKWIFFFFSENLIFPLIQRTLFIVTVIVRHRINVQCLINKESNPLDWYGMISVLPMLKLFIMPVLWLLQCNFILPYKVQKKAPLSSSGLIQSK